jgi:hypothetical protein
MGANPPKIGIPPTAAGGVVVQASAESAEGLIFRQDKSSGPRVPNAVSKALG